MKNYLSTLLVNLIALQFISCDYTISIKDEIIDDDLNQIIINHDMPFVNTKDVFDTLINSDSYQIIISKNHLTSRVFNEYKNEDTIIHYLYHDAEISLKIKKNNDLILDTLFDKKLYKSITEEGFTENAVFHMYRKFAVKNDEVQFIGTICKPETDWCLDFIHHYNIKTNKMSFEKLKDPDEM
jgi:hypothetical protein